MALMTATRRRTGTAYVDGSIPKGPAGGTAIGPQKMHRAGLPLRPTSRLTFAEASADRGAINLRRSVLGAHGNLGRATHPVKWRKLKKGANCGRLHSKEISLESSAATLHRCRPIHDRIARE